MYALDSVVSTLGGLHVPHVDNPAITARKYLLLSAAQGHCGDFSLDAIIRTAGVDLHGEKDTSISS